MTEKQAQEINENPITWLQFNNAIPIIFAVIAMIASIIFFYATLSGRISVIEQQQKNTDENIKDIKQTLTHMEDQQDEMSLDVAKIKVALEIRNGENVQASHSATTAQIGEVK